MSEAPIEERLAVLEQRLAAAELAADPGAGPG